MNKSLVSICVPCYNGAKYLEQCLDSILSQTLSSFEVVVVDDNSTDNTRDIVERYVQKDQRIKLYKNSANLGLVGNWNRCLELANAEWIKFVFQDDYIRPDCVEKMVDSCLDNQFLIAVCKRSFVFENVTEDIKSLYESVLMSTDDIGLFKQSKWKADEFCSLVVDNITDNFIGEPTSVLFHRSVVTNYGKFCPDLIQFCDLEYWVRIASNVGILTLADQLAYFRVHNQSASMSNEFRREYLKNVVDSIVLRGIYATGKYFKKLRRVGVTKSFNLQKDFRQRLLAELMSGCYESYAQRSLSPRLLEWYKVNPRYSGIWLSRYLPDPVLMLYIRFRNKVYKIFGLI